MNRQVHADRESEAVREMKRIYMDMIHTGAGEKETRKKLQGELLSRQREDGSWSVIGDDRAPMDIRVEYIYIPTYYATAALMYQMTADDMADRELTEALSAGLRKAGERGLNGHGFEATRQKLDALKVYKEAGLYPWMKKYGERFPEFSQMIRDILDEFLLALATGRTFSDWEVDFREDFQREIDDYTAEMIPWVWYAAYGSNISRERFMRYINKCSDSTEPQEDRSFELPYDIFFAGNKSNWDNLGTAFLDDSRPGMSLGRIYKISRRQYEEVQYYEGRDYTKRIFLGMEDGIPVYTFTAEKAPDRNIPCVRYLQTIAAGLKETYPDRHDLVHKAYLLRRIGLDETEWEILRYIRSSEHGVTLQKIADEGAVCGITRVRKAVKRLVSCGLLRQDSRSTRAGRRLDDREAVVYTNKEERDVIDLMMVM